MLTYYCDQAPAGEISILAGVVVDDAHEHEVSQAIMDFKASQGLRATNPIKTAGWREDPRYSGMQGLADVPALLTKFCEFIAGQDKLLLLACLLNNDERELALDEVDYFLIQNCGKRVQFLVQDQTGEYPDGPVSEWFRAQPPRNKKGVRARIVADHPGTALESKWAEHYSRAWKSYARPFTHWLHMAQSINFDHTRTNAFLQIADVIAGAIRSYVAGRARGRFEILLPRFRTDNTGRTDGYGLVFDPKPGKLWEQFRADYPSLSTPSRRRTR